MDLSALIFVALAVAWAVYLIPKALRHHEESASTRSVEGFSERLRVLARREPVDSRTSRLVVETRTKTAATGSTAVATAAAEEAEATPSRPLPSPAARRAAAQRAARRRLRVVVAILLSGVVVGVLAGLGHLAWAYLAIPGGVLVAWLVACRLMVRRERAVPVAPRARLPHAPAEEKPEAEDAVEVVEVEVEVDVVEDGPDGPSTEEISAVVADEVAPEPEPQPEAEREAPASKGWDPVPVTLPTYVAKEPAVRRTVRTIDLDSTGVWTSGRTVQDAALAREADQARSSSSADRSTERRASGD
ncbi:divisome protein SepX/GlpR [Nocardioides sp. GXZ039]|uniref:divisome protein SepX/GlpR n=1 Tax=Nocardioides sp. GXZ039 TaxID=3136018 RepID=UPI0030F3A027